MITTNGNGGGIAATKPEISGRGLRHRDLPTSRLAAIIAQVLEGEATYKPTARELAWYRDVPEAYVSVARGLSPEKRQAIATGKNATSIAALLHPPHPMLALPAPKPIDDAELANIARTVGSERMLQAAVAVENSMTS